MGDDSVWITYNHWMSVDETNGQLTASDCPTQYCCQIADGCDYIEDSEDLCAPYRDPNSPLCGKCEEGYSEMLGTVSCGICDRNHYEYAVFPALIAVAFSAYLLFFDRSSTTPSGMFLVESLVNEYSH